jgi:GDP-L-fucose synthase
MKKDSRIYVAGHTGLVGSALCRTLKNAGYHHIIRKTHGELDLTRQHDVETFFEIERPEYVFLAAAKVGGIYANSVYPADFISQNLLIQNNVIDTSFKNHVKKLLFLGSSCIYPRNCPQPIKEEYLLAGELEKTNEAYAVAKISGIKMCEYYYKQHGANFISVMPTNLFGPNDNFDLETSHVLPALIRKFHDAKTKWQQTDPGQRSRVTVEIWGSGKPKREFLHADDLSDACLFIMNHVNAGDIYNLDISQINIGTGQDISIMELCRLIKQIVGFEGELVFDSSKPDGTPQKRLDISRLQQLGWRPKIAFKDGLKMTYDWYLNNLAVCSRRSIIK